MRYETREVTVYPNADGAPAQFSIGDDEKLLDSTLSGSHELVLWIATPTTAERCMATTADGTRCDNDALDDSNYCQVPTHGDADE